jgi:hypothetical protein
MTRSTFAPFGSAARGNGHAHPTRVGHWQAVGTKRYRGPYRGRDWRAVQGDGDGSRIVQDQSV